MHPPHVYPSSKLRLGALVLSAVAWAAGAAAAAEPVTSWSFQLGGADAPAGAIAVTPASLYSPATGYGFEPGSLVEREVASAPNSVGPTALGSSRPFAFSAAVPEGNYRVTLLLGSPAAETVVTVDAESRRLMVEHLRLPAGVFTTRVITVNVRRPRLSTGAEVDLDSREMDLATRRATSLSWDDKLTLTFRDAHPAVAAIKIEKVDDAVTVFVVGDSTVTDQPRGPGSSWGQMLPRWFEPEVAVANHAESGETLKGFLKERRWAKVLDAARPGDYVLIEFGTNDSKSSGPQNMYPNQDFSETYAPADTTYRELLRRFVADVRRRGAHPVILSPSARRGETPDRPGSLAAYAASAMATARELGVPGIDLNAMGRELNAALGPDAGRQFADRTHHVQYGSYLQAKCVVLGLKRAGLPLARYIVGDFGDFDPRHPAPTPGEFDVPPDGGPAKARGTQP